MCNKRLRVYILLLIYRIAEYGMGHHWVWWFVTINSLLLSMEGTYYEHVCVVVLGKS